MWFEFPLQAIGFKEFLPYFQAVASGIPLTAPDNVGSNCCTPSRVDGDASVAQPHADIFAACVDDMKRNTRRYVSDALSQKYTWPNENHLT